MKKKLGLYRTSMRNATMFCLQNSHKVKLGQVYVYVPFTELFSQYFRYPEEATFLADLRSVEPYEFQRVSLEKPILTWKRFQDVLFICQGINARQVTSLTYPLHVEPTHLEQTAHYAVKIVGEYDLVIGYITAIEESRIEYIS